MPERQPESSSQLQFRLSEKASGVFDSAIDMARTQGSKYLATEHLMLALLTQPDIQTIFDQFKVREKYEQELKVFVQPLPQNLPRLKFPNWVFPKSEVQQEQESPFSPTSALATMVQRLKVDYKGRTVGHLDLLYYLLTGFSGRAKSILQDLLTSNDWGSLLQKIKTERSKPTVEAVFAELDQILKLKRT